MSEKIKLNRVSRIAGVSMGSIAGENGAGVPDGGAKGQFLSKASDGGFDTQWVYLDNSLDKGKSDKLDGIEEGAQKNVRPDWNSTGGDSEILNKPPLGTAALMDAGAIATKGDLESIQQVLRDKADIVDGKVPESQLPSYVDNVQEYSDFASLPAEGSDNIIYITTDTNKTYRWGGTTYVEVAQTISLGETASTAYRGDRGKTAYDHTLITSGNPHNVTKADIGLSNVDNTSDANKPLSTAMTNALANKANKSDLDSVSGATPVITTVDGWRKAEYSDRIEYTRKQNVSLSCGTGGNRYKSQETGITTPEGVTLANSDEHYVSMVTTERTTYVAISQNSTSGIIMANMYNSWTSSVSFTIKLCIKLIRYK